jgi:lipopolysaccharide/colanic/teichoic acid biosynthesis glycosyltransferase
MYLDRSEPSSVFREASADSAPASARPRHGWYVPVKSVVEWIAALVLFVATFPLVLALGALVRLTSPGPAFYSQAPVGRK